MADLKHEARPASQAEHYRFFKNAESGRVFKAKHEIGTAADGRPVITVTVSPVDGAGKALANPAGAPDVGSHGHHFTAVELADPDFDMDARVATILHSAVQAKEDELLLRDRLAGLSTAWGGNKALPLAKKA
jgi:hypothetical protein